MTAVRAAARALAAAADRWHSRRPGLWLTWIGIAFIVFFVMSSPTDAGSVVMSAFDGITTAANQLAVFVKGLVP